MGELERLRLVLDHLPDEDLMVALEQDRGRGRDDYPVRAVWNSILAGIVYQHPSIESLRRELLRNAQLRQLCGFNVLLGARAAPPAWVYTRFLRKLLGRLDQLETMFRRTIVGLRQELPDFGEVLALDGKAIESHARGRKRDEKRPRRPDGRRDTDADWGTKTYRGQRDDGSLWQKAISWFGYCLHLVVDTKYELPVDFMVTRASASEVKIAHRLVDRMAVERPELLVGCKHFLGDKAYDDVKLLDKLW
ncbi:MAG: transposase, partial [Anaerolineales bacterium]|nr:transposase [Anaerolineales bacterium]